MGKDKLPIIKGLLLRPQGVNRSEALAILRWKSISFGLNARRLGMKYRVDRSEKPPRYYGIKPVKEEVIIEENDMAQTELKFGKIHPPEFDFSKLSAAYVLFKSELSALSKLEQFKIVGQLYSQVLQQYLDTLSEGNEK